jgi:hypothetical protein
VLRLLTRGKGNRASASRRDSEAAHRNRGQHQRTQARRLTDWRLCCNGLPPLCGRL